MANCMVYPESLMFLMRCSSEEVFRVLCDMFFEYLQAYSTEGRIVFMETYGFVEFQAVKGTDIDVLIAIATEMSNNV